MRLAITMPILIAAVLAFESAPALAQLSPDYDAIDEKIGEARRRAFQWLVRHQCAAGNWSSHDFMAESGTRCRNHEGLLIGKPGRGARGHDVGVTSLTMLAFLASGTTHQASASKAAKKAFKNALRWLLTQQDRNPNTELARRGTFGFQDRESWIYSHALATYLLVELLVVSSDSRLRRPAAEALSWALRSQERSGGWKPSKKMGVNSATTAAMVLPVWIAHSFSDRHKVGASKGRLDASLRDAARWFESVTDREGRTGYERAGQPLPRPAFNPKRTPYPYAEMPFLDTWVTRIRPAFEDQFSAKIARGVDRIEMHPPRWTPPKPGAQSAIHLPYWWLATSAMAHRGGPRWTKWRVAIAEALLDSQRVGGDEDGSWDPIGEWGSVGGRVYSTALSLMILSRIYGKAEIKERVRSQNLLRAREGFVTKLRSTERDPFPVPQAPSRLFKRVRYSTPLGPMVAHVSRGAKSSKRSPAIIWLSGGIPAVGFGDYIWNEQPWDNDQSARAYREAGLTIMYPTVRGTFDNPGHPESFFGEVNDVIAAAEYLSRQPDVDPKRIYLGGHSTGATLALLVAAATDRFAGVIAFGPASSAGNYGANSLNYDPENELENRLRSPVEFVSAITVPTLILEGQQGNYSSLVDLQRQYRSDNVRFADIENGDHFNVLAPINDWLAKRIASPSNKTPLEVSKSEAQAAFDRFVKGQK